MKRFFTHAGVFHADDVLCAVMASIVYPGIEIHRVFDAPEETEDDIIADIGGGKYDHHQPDAPMRADGFLHCSASRMWEDGYAEKIISLLHPSLTAEQVDSVKWGVDTGLLRCVSAIDNGVKTLRSKNGILGGCDILSISTMVSQFNPNWNSSINADDAFLDAVEFVKGILIRMIARCASCAEGQSIVAAACEKAKKSSVSSIVVLPRFVPWQSYVCRFAEDALVVVFPDKRGGYKIQLVPVTTNSRDTRISMPKSWCGLSGEEAEKKVPGMTFCHKSGFLAAFRNLEYAVNAAESVIASAS